jgi:hypothetical protein
MTEQQQQQQQQQESHNHSSSTSTCVCTVLGLLTISLQGETSTRGPLCHDQRSYLVATSYLQCFALHCSSMCVHIVMWACFAGMYISPSAVTVLRCVLSRSKGAVLQALYSSESDNQHVRPVKSSLSI